MLIKDIISDIKKSNKKVTNLEIILGTFSNWGGSYYLSKTRFDKLLNYTQNIPYQKKNNYKKLSYVYYDKKLIIFSDKSKDMDYIRESYKIYGQYDTMIAMIKDSRKIDKERFPIISNYSDVIDETIEEYVFDKYIRIQFLRESNRESDDKYSIRIKFREINFIDLNKLNKFNFFEE